VYSLIEALPGGWAAATVRHRRYARKIKSANRGPLQQPPGWHAQRIDRIC
jgi:hypothetical protein